jgi:hypothetical protein
MSDTKEMSKRQAKGTTRAHHWDNPYYDWGFVCCLPYHLAKLKAG